MNRLHVTGRIHLSYPRQRLILIPLEAALRAIREDVATEYHLSLFEVAVQIGTHIDRRGCPLGMAGHFAAAAQAARAIHARAHESDPPDYTLHLAEIEVLQTAFDLHEHQLGRVSSHLYALASESVSLRPRMPSAPIARAAYPQTESLPL